MIALLAISIASMTLMVSAQIGVPQPVETVGYISFAPTLIGVGQEATVNLWVFPMPTNYLYQPYYKGFSEITVTFVKPDGTKDTFMPLDGTGLYPAGQVTSLGSLFFYYKPNTVGNWSVSFTMPAQNLTDLSGTVLYQACTSDPAYFTVTEEPQYAGLVNGYPWGPLPDDNVYWSSPVNSNNRDWNQISGEWLQGAWCSLRSNLHGVTCRHWQPYGSAPNTAHIVWKEWIRRGGLIGGDYGSISYASANTMQRGVIMGGKVFLTLQATPYDSEVNKFICVDLASGEVLYTADGVICAGLHLPGNPFAQSNLDESVVLESSFGSSPTPYLFGYSPDYTIWKYYDPYTGILMRTIYNCTSARAVHLVDGTNFAYGTAGGKLIAWDISKVVGNNWPTGITWSVPLPKTLMGTAPAALGLSTDASVVVLRTTNQYWGYSTNDGSLLWNLTLNYAVSGNQAINLYGVDDLLVFDPVKTTFNCYDMKTGLKLWESDSYSDSSWATTWTVYGAETNDYDNLYLMFPDGTMTAISLDNGKTLWRSKAIASTEYTNNAVPLVDGMILVGGNLYGYAGYSVGYQINPLPRHGMLVCINATTGDITYTLNGGFWPIAAANGYVVGFGEYDGNAYCLGKGQTSTSVTIQNNVVTNHATTLITGNVLDQSPAQPGTPAVADSSMSEWMDYLNMQNATLLNNPPKPDGVPVTLTAVDPNGNTISIGSTTTDSEGNFKVIFVPENVGTYTVRASFDGTDSYFASYSETALAVIAAPESTPTTTAIANPPYELYTIGSAVAVIIALAVVAMLLLRKKP